MLGGAWPCDSISIPRYSITVVMPRPCSLLRSAAKPLLHKSFLGYAIARRVFALLWLCMANLRRSIPQPLCANQVYSLPQLCSSVLFLRGSNPRQAKLCHCHLFDAYQFPCLSNHCLTSPLPIQSQQNYSLPLLFYFLFVGRMRVSPSRYSSI